MGYKTDQMRQLREARKHGRWTSVRTLVAKGVGANPTPKRAKKKAAKKSTAKKAAAKKTTTAPQTSSASNNT